MSPALDALFFSFVFTWIAVTCVFGAFWLITIPEVRWYLQDVLDWFVLRFSPRVEVWATRHSRLIKIIDRVVNQSRSAVSF